jgi:hypothetical protein
VKSSPRQTKPPAPTVETSETDPEAEDEDHVEDDVEDNGATDGGDHAIGAQRSKADVCLFFQWTSTGLLISISWVDYILIAGTKTSVAQAKIALKKHFTLDEQGELQEYVGCKIERDKLARWMKLTQPEMIQSFSDEFDLPTETAVIPAKHGEVLSKDDGVPMNKGLVKTYRSGVGRCST